MILLLYFLWGGAVVYFNCWAATFAAQRSKKLNDTPLPDVLHDILPKIDDHAPDYLLLLCFVFVFCRGLHVAPSDVARLLVCLSLRPVFVCMTTFPTCYRVEPSSVYSRLFLSRHDLMFSGHTCVFMFFGLVVHGVLGCVVRFVFPLSLNAARQHYTVDVAVAMLLYSFVCVKF